MKNNLTKFREAAGLSTAELAAQVEVSVLDIHRIEHNRLLAPVYVATRISLALGKTIQNVFPGAEAALNQLKNEREQPNFLADKSYRKLREVGLEADTRQHTLVALLRGHKQTISFPIQARDADRLCSVVKDERPDGPAQFIRFDSANLCVAINLERLVYIHFLWDAAFITMMPVEKSDDEDDPDEVVRVFLNHDDAPIILRVEPEDGNDIDNERNYLNNVFLELDSGFLERHQRVHIVDEAGESAFIRVGDIALITAPLSDLYCDELSLRDEDGNLPRQ